MDELLEDIEEQIKHHYRDVLKEYKFRSEEAEDSAWVIIDDIIENVKDAIKEGDNQLDCELTDNARHEDDSDMESFIYNCQL